jgi:SAM-dependent methyltransferase
MYVCPDCKTPLNDLACPACRVQFSTLDGIPLLLSRRPEFERAREIAALYDSLYRRGSNVWEAMGRNSEEFLAYFTTLLSEFPSKRFLEIGCGEGMLLAAVNGEEKFAVDLSTEAMKTARSRVDGRFSVALAEALPFADKQFDLILSVGVMEHFLDEQKAFEEIRRILKPGGHFVSLIHVGLTFWDRVALKIPVYFFPRPRPIQFVRWLMGKLAPTQPAEPSHFIYQPIQRIYTTRSARRCFERNGLRVVDVLHTRKYPQLPLRDINVVVYIGQRKLEGALPDRTDGIAVDGQNHALG